MKKLKLLVPKKILRTSFLSSLLCYSICTLLITIVFSLLSVYKGLNVSLKKNIIQNYNSHISIYSENHTTVNAQQITSWWSDSSLILKDPTSINFLRATTPRSILPALLNPNNKEIPIQLTIISNDDSSVFSDFISSTSKGVAISQNHIYIGDKLAEQYSLQTNDTVTLYIPTLNYTISNLTIDYIFNSHDNFHDHYSVFTDHSTLSNILDTKFQKYHLRFSATPFLSLLETNVLPYTGGQLLIHADDLLTYQYTQLNYLKNNIFTWSFYLYILCGFIIFLISFLVYNTKINDINKYTYMTGFITKMSLNQSSIVNLLFRLIIINGMALGLLYLFLKSPPLSTFLFTPNQGLYDSFNLPLPYFFKVLFPYETIFLAVLGGIIVPLLSYLLMMFTYYILPNFSDEKNKASYIIIGMVIIGLLGMICSDKVIYNSFADKARTKYWENIFFGRYSLTDKNYHEYKNSNLIPKYFQVPKDLYTILNEKSITYLSTLEEKGQVFVLSNNIQTQEFKRDVSIKSLQGNVSIFSNILTPLSLNGVVIGKDIADSFRSNNILSFSMQGKTNTTPIIVTHIVDLPIGDFNNTIFINQTNLANLLDINVLSINKIQIARGKKNLTPYSNETISLNSIEENTKYWRTLTDISLLGDFITLILQITIYSIYIYLIMFYFYIKNKNILIFHYIWGLHYTPVKKHILIAGCSFIIGVSLSWIKNLITLIIPSQIPPILLKDNIVPNQLHFQINWLIGLKIITVIVIIFFLCYTIFTKMVLHYQKKIVNYHHKNNY